MWQHILSLYETNKEMIQECVPEAVNGMSSGDGPNDSHLESLSGSVNNKVTGSTSQEDDSLYWLMLESLMSDAPVENKGQYWSLADVFKCGHCQRLIPMSLSHRTSCLENRSYLAADGELIGAHERNTEWNSSKDMEAMKLIYGERWKIIYWKLWARCHYIYCTLCDFFFPMSEFDKCRQHPGEPVFTFMEEGGISTKMFPVGRYTCCNAKAYRWECIPRQKITGCRTLCHKPYLKGIFPGIIPRLIRQDFGDKICTNIFGGKSFYKPGQRFSGVIQRGLYNLSNSSIKSQGDFVEERQHLRPVGWPVSFIGKTHYGENAIDVFMTSCDSSLRNESMKSTSSQHRIVDKEFYIEGCCLPIHDINTEDKCMNKPIRYSKRTNRHKKSKCGLLSDCWVSQFSTRYNQDWQRQYEENVFSLLSTTLASRAQNSVKVVTEMKMKTEPGMLKENDPEDVDGSESLDEDSKSSENDSQSSCCSTLGSSIRMRLSRSTSIWNSFIPFAGTFVKIDAALRQMHADYKKAVSEGKTPSADDFGGLPWAKLIKPRKPPTFNVQQLNLGCRQSGRWSLLMKSELPMVSTSTKVKVLQIPLMKDGDAHEFYQEIWRFDKRTNELYYISAAYVPLSSAIKAKHQHYLKSTQNELSNDLSDMLALDKSWNAFLLLISETEPLPVGRNEKLRQNIKRKSPVRIVVISENDSSNIN